LPLLLTGVTGVAGYGARFAFLDRYPGQVVSVRPVQTPEFTGADVVGIESDDEPALERLFRHYGFRTVLNATGNCALKSCELNANMARRINTTSAAVIARLANRFGARLVHVSSDLVFSGTLGRSHTETDATDPVTVYGKTMAEGELAVRELCPGAAILRMSLPMGPSFNGHAGAIDWIQSRFRAGRPATLYYDEVRSATYCEDLNAVFEAFLAIAEPGLFHLAGPRGLTLNQIGQIVNRVGGYLPELLHGKLRHEAGPMPPRAGDCRMDGAKLRSLLGGEAFKSWPVGADLWPTSRAWHFERLADEGNGPERLRARLYRYPT
jgi:dTDP-4-dehydrorhamnose reductase